MLHRNRRRVLKTLPVVVLTLSAAAAATASVRDASEPVPGPSYVQAAPGTAATQEAELMDGTTDSCGEVTMSTALPIPPPFLRCDDRFGPWITFTRSWEQTRWAGLVFDPSGTDVHRLTGCVRRLDQHWWAVISVSSPSRCPGPYHFNHVPGDL